MSYKNTFQSWTDISTRQNKITLITVYAGGSLAFDRCQSFFNSFKYFKLGKVTIKLIPVSTLPTDPIGVGKDSADKIDPRDLMTPGCVRITNGEDFYWEINNESDPVKSHEVYNTMVMDPRWFKWNLQKGLIKSAYPRYYVVGQTRQDYYPGSVINVPMGAPYFGTNFASTGSIELGIDADHLGQVIKPQFSSDRGLIQTGQSGRLGWMPTDAIIELGFPGTDINKREMAIANVPQIELFRVLLPPVYNTNFYYRMFITETIYFKEKVIEPPLVKFGETMGRFAPPDRFIRDAGTTVATPVENIAPRKPSKPLVPNNLEDNHANQGRLV